MQLKHWERSSNSTSKWSHSCHWYSASADERETVTCFFCFPGYRCMTKLNQISCNRFARHGTAASVRITIILKVQRIMWCINIPCLGEPLRWWTILIAASLWPWHEFCINWLRIWTWYIIVVLKCNRKCTVPVVASNGKYGSYTLGTCFRILELIPDSI